jgi:phage gpG-like protein
MAGFKNSGGMRSASVQILLRLERISKAVKRAADGALDAAAFVIQQRAQDKIQTAKGPSEPGQPPHSKRGRLRRAILYSYSKQIKEAVIGPAASRMATAGAAHEFGGRFRRTKYPARPYMGPTLAENAHVIPEKFRGSIGP